MPMPVSEFCNMLDIEANLHGLGDYRISVSRAGHIFIGYISWFPRYIPEDKPLNISISFILNQVDDPHWDKTLVNILHEKEREIRAKFDELKEKYGAYN